MFLWYSFVAIKQTYFGYTLTRAEGDKMKKGLHPEYKLAKVTCGSCGNEFEIGSTASEIKVDTCNQCHPFYTGKQRFAQAAGRIEKFNKKFGLK